MPTAAEEPAGRGEEREDRRRRRRSTPDPAGPLVARVVQDRRRPVRRPADVPPGPLRARSTARPTPGTRTASEDERIGQLLLLHGKDQEPIGELKAGEIGAVAKLTVTETGDTLSSKRRSDHPAAARLPGPDPHGRDRAPDEGRPRQDGRGAPADARGGAVGAGRAVGDRRAAPRRDRARPTSRSSASGSSASSAPRS